MAGRYPHSFRAPFNLPNSGLGIEDYNRQGIDVNEKLISTVLQDAGYFTGAVGKWHLGIESQFHPNKRGFDDYYGFLGGGHMYFPEKYGPIYERQVNSKKETFNEYIVPLEHNGVPVAETEYVTDGLSREAVRFVNEAAAKDEPFFLYLAYNAPHTPLEAKEEDLAKFAGIKDEKRRTYAAMVYAVDRGAGKLVEALTATDSLDNTLIVFLSDNGGKIGAGSNNSPLDQGKGSVCEGGIRVPMFFHWPGKVPAGERFDHPVSALDFYPTFARLADVKVPTDKQLDGKDIWDAFKAGRSPRKDETIFALRHWKGFHNVGIRRNHWKVSKRGPNSPWALFNLNQDIREKKDISSQHPEIVQMMVDSARQWSESHTAPGWFDNKGAEKAWQELKMPRYDSTFAVGNSRPVAPKTATHKTTAPEPTRPSAPTKKPSTAESTTALCTLPFGDAGTLPGNWKLVTGQSDEFDSPRVDCAKWNIDTKDFGPWSWEPENVTQKDGSMHLQMVHKDHRRGKQELHYTSGLARNDRTITYGYFEARIKGCSRYPGACPSFWLYSIGPQNRHIASDGETVSYSEIDIVEMQQSEYDFETKKHFPVTRIDCNLHTTLIKDGKRVWARPNNRPDLCKTHFDSPWDPREDYHVYGVRNSKDWIIWYIDGKEVGRKPNLYWHLPMHVTLSLGLRYPFVGYKNDERFAVSDKTTTEGFPTTMSVDYVRVWQTPDDVANQAPVKKTATDWTKAEYIAKEKAKWAKNGWRWNQSKVESNFAEVDTNNDGLASGKERQAWFAKKAAESKNQ